MLTRKQAADVARVDAQKHQLGFRVRQVLSLDELEGRAPNLYGVSLAGCWVAYIEPVGPPGLFSSTIIVMDQASGRVMYCGSANDEG